MDKKGPKFPFFFLIPLRVIQFFGGVINKYSTKHALISPPGPHLLPWRCSLAADRARGDGLARTYWRSKTWAANLRSIPRYPEKWCDKMHDSPTFKMHPFFVKHAKFWGSDFQDTPQWKLIDSEFRLWRTSWGRHLWTSGVASVSNWSLWRSSKYSDIPNDHRLDTTKW